MIFNSLSFILFSSPDSIFAKKDIFDYFFHLFVHIPKPGENNE